MLGRRFGGTQLSTIIFDVDFDGIVWPDIVALRVFTMCVVSRVLAFCQRSEQQTH
jgi:hypothetical protein